MLIDSIQDAVTTIEVIDTLDSCFFESEAEIEEIGKYVIIRKKEKR